MARQLVPRTRAGGEWTEARYWLFIRTALREKTRYWPPWSQVRNTSRRKYRGKKSRHKWEYQCAACRNWFFAEDIRVDHIEPVGQLKSYDDIGPFVQRLFCEADGLRLLCEQCHEERHRG